MGNSFSFLHYTCISVCVYAVKCEACSTVTLSNKSFHRLHTDWFPMLRLVGLRTNLKLTGLKPLQRLYATEGAPVASGALRLTLACPNKVLFKNKDVTQVNLPSTAGSIGILADHVPTVEELVPGVVEVLSSAQADAEKFFVAGGFATVTEGSELQINAVDAYPISAFRPEAVRTLLEEARKNSTSSDEEVAAQAKVELELLEALSAVVK